MCITLHHISSLLPNTLEQLFHYHLSVPDLISDTLQQLFNLQFHIRSLDSTEFIYFSISFTYDLAGYTFSLFLDSTEFISFSIGFSGFKNTFQYVSVVLRIFFNIVQSFSV